MQHAFAGGAKRRKPSVSAGVPFKENVSSRGASEAARCEELAELRRLVSRTEVSIDDICTKSLWSGASHCAHAAKHLHVMCAEVLAACVRRGALQHLLISAGPKRHITMPDSECVRRAIWTRSTTSHADGALVERYHTERLSGPAGDRLRSPGVCLQEQLGLVERDLGAMQMEALELRGTARAREAEAAALRNRVAAQEQQVTFVAAGKVTVGGCCRKVRTCTAGRGHHSRCWCPDLPAPVPAQIAAFGLQLVRCEGSDSLPPAAAEADAAEGGVSILRAELAAKEALLQRAQVHATPALLHG